MIRTDTKHLLLGLGAVLYSLLSQPGLAETFALPPADQNVVGELRVTKARQADTLLDIARAFDLGYEEIVLANPEVDRWLPGENTRVVLPTIFVLPDAPRDGIVLNVPEMRLYYYPKPQRGEAPVVITYPVSVGRMDWKTPLGKTSVIQKQKDPPWYPPQSIKDEHAAKGDILPDIVPGGPGNPLGRFALRLGIPGYLIHGTDKEFGIGMRVTHGCVRLYPENIESLFGQVPVGTPVHIVNQPTKLGWTGRDLVLEAHPPLEEDAGIDEASQAALLLDIAANAERFGADVSPGRIRLAVTVADGIPRLIGR
ncbi:MAG: L,D-transpeptidase family protein [Oceanospirillaceae bacterium]|nr:L,D-transpeptidase family protein [Oceanospirillaceae bacterium]